MPKTIRAALLYFVIVLGTGFVLGMFRVPILVPRIGERWAELAEMPIMAAVLFFAAGFVLRRYPEICSPGRSLAAGFLALALSVAAELGLAVALQHQNVGRVHQKPRQSVGLGLRWASISIRSHAKASPLESCASRTATQ